MKITFAFGAIAALALADAAHATDLSYFYTVADETAPFSVSFTLPAFDTALGTLTGVTLSLTNNSTASVSIYNGTSSTQSFTDATASIPLEVTGPASVTIDATATAGPFSGTVLPGINNFPGLPADNVVSETVPSADFSSYEAPPSSLLLDFTIGGMAGTYSGSAIPGVFFGGSAVSGGTVELTYDYVAIPEPASWSLMLIGVGLLGASLRRRAAIAAGA